MFELTDAVRTFVRLQVVPRQGFRRDEYRDDNSGKAIPVIMAAATRWRLMDQFSNCWTHWDGRRCRT